MPSACQIRRGLSSAIWLTSSFTVHIRFRPTASHHVVLSTPQFCIIRSARSSGLFGQSGAPPHDLHCPPSESWRPLPPFHCFCPRGAGRCTLCGPAQVHMDGTGTSWFCHGPLVKAAADKEMSRNLITEQYNHPLCPTSSSLSLLR
jgi:hypothetical protein